MKRCFVIVCLMCLSTCAHAKAMAVSLPTLVTYSDVIARVKVISVGPKTIGLSPSFRHLRKLATVQVVQGLKGKTQGATLTIECDNGLGCPNVLYHAGEDCLAFLFRLQNGHYVTVGSYYGKHTITNGQIQDWYFPHQSFSHIRLNTAIAQITKSLHRRRV